MKKRLIIGIVVSVSVTVLVVFTAVLIAVISSSSTSAKTKDCTEHNFRDWKEIRETTCQKEGKMSRRCVNCGERETKKIEIKEHIPVSVAGRASTCTESGISDSTVCKSCKKVLTEAQKLPKAEHDIVYTEGMPATCQSSGYTERSDCRVCKTMISTSEYIPQLPHNEKIIPGDNITCLQIGIIDGKECADCGTVTVEQITGYGNHEYQNGACIHCSETENVSKGLKMELNQSGTGYIVVNEGTCTDKDIVIPRLYNGLPVVKIAKSAFWSQTLITSVVIPSSVTEIGEEAFINCKSLTSITFNGSVERIEASAFRGCTSLEEVVLPESLTYIGEKAFYYCTSLKSIVIGSNELTHDLTIPTSMLAKCSNLTNVVIKTNVRTFHKEVFYSCYDLRYITYDGTMEQWGKITFEDQRIFAQYISTIRCKDGDISV